MTKKGKTLVIRCFSFFFEKLRITKVFPQKSEFNSRIRLKSDAIHWVYLARNDNNFCFKNFHFSLSNNEIFDLFVLFC